MAAPPALVATGGRLHLFWLDGSVQRSRLLHTVVDESGRMQTPSQTIAEDVDSRAGWPVAAGTGDRIAVAWMGRAGEGYALHAAVLDFQGRVVRAPRAVAPPGEESGRVAIISDVNGWLVAWSQFINPHRQVWLIRITAQGDARSPARALADGDGSALAPGSRLLWWRPVGFDTYRLVMVTAGAQSFAPQPLTGTISLTIPLPPIPLDGGRSLTVLLPLVERSFATTGRLYLLRPGGIGASERTPLTPQSVFEVTAATRGNEALIAWSAVAGRRRNTEIAGVLLDLTSGTPVEEFRVSYTTEGSRRPAVAPLGGGWRAAWLEVAGEREFHLVLARTVEGRPASFLLGVPELDLRRPGRLVSFGATVAVSVLPYAGLFAAAFFLPALLLQGLAGVVFGGFSFAAEIRGRRWLRYGLFLGVVVLLEIAARSLIPGRPSITFLLLAMAAPGSAGAALVSKVVPRVGEVGFWLSAVGAVILQMTAALFPWGARLLSQF